MAKKTALLADIGEIQLYKRRGTSTLRLSIGHDGTIRVTMPYWIPYQTALSFVKKRREWILSKRIVNKPIRNGQQIGKSHQVRFLATADASPPKSRIVNNGEIRIYHPSGTELDTPHIQEIAQKAAIRALKKEAMALLPERLDYLARQHDFDYKNVKVRELRSRWGSCSSDKVITLNCYLMQLPWDLIDYVLLHELMHTKIMVHGEPFWSAMQRITPEVMERRRQIKTYRPALLPI